MPDHSFEILDDNVEAKIGRICISTMHLAKGLEFRAVVVMGCDDEVIPLQERIESVTDEGDLEDVYNTERNLLYVACTRARDQLLVTSTAPASEFLDGLDELMSRITFLSRSNEDQSVVREVRMKVDDRNAFPNASSARQILMDSWDRSKLDELLRLSAISPLDRHAPQSSDQIKEMDENLAALHSHVGRCRQIASYLGPTG